MSIAIIRNINHQITPPTPKIVTWADGTDAEILQMIEMADRGEIDLTEYWNVGDERVVHLNAINSYPTGVNETHIAKDVTIVLAAMDTGDTDNTNPCYKYQYVTQKAGRSYPSFITYQKDFMPSYGVITTTQSGQAGNAGWNGQPRRTWCNDYYKTALPTDFAKIYKRVVLRQATAQNVMQVSDGDYFFFPTEKEMHGARTYSPPVEADEFPQWQYFVDVNNRKSTTSRWVRSAENSGADYWCLTSAAGGRDDTRPWGACGICPCGCI